jgi:hypothetical protein
MGDDRGPPGYVLFGPFWGMLAASVAGSFFLCSLAVGGPRIPHCAATLLL